MRKFQAFTKSKKPSDLNPSDVKDFIRFLAVQIPGYTGAFVDGLLEKKYKNIGKDLIWQWFFPAKTLTLVPNEGKYRRYHLHETYVNKAILRAVRKAKMLK